MDTSPIKDSDNAVAPESSTEKPKDSIASEDTTRDVANDDSPVTRAVNKEETNNETVDTSSDDKERAKIQGEDATTRRENSKTPVKELAANTEDDNTEKETLDNPAKVANNDSPKINAEKTRVSLILGETKEAKRKRRNPSDQQDETLQDDVETRAKRVKVKNTNDNYCWRCHKDSVDARCSACPRSWHRKCMGGQPPTSINENWICGECATILRAENAETRSEVVAHMSIDHLCMLLKYIVERMRSCPGSEPFWKPVDLAEVPNYMDYVVRPMDLNLLESNVRAKLYGSTDAFMADAKWIQHNCIVFNTCGGVYADTSKLTNAAKQIIKTAKQEVAEIEACPDCYARGRNLPRPHHMWFIEACRRPHPLIWAKLKGFPFWPAKAMPRLNGQGHVDVRFFGQHDRAWVSPKDVYLYSRDPPAPMPRKRKLEMAECIKEITRHCRKLEMAFGPFQFAPAKTPYIPNDPTQIKLMLPEYDPSRPSSNETLGDVPLNATARRKSPFRKRSTLLKRKIENESATTVESTVESSTKDTTILPKTESGSDQEKTNEAATIQASENASGDSPRPKKRAKKTLNNVERKNSTQQEKEPSSPIQVIETSSTSTSVDDNPIKVEPMADDTPEQESKIALQTKPKIEKTVVPLEKSLAALLRKVNPKGRLSHPRNSGGKIIATVQSTANSGKIEPTTKTSLIKVYKPKARMLDKVNAEKALKSTHEKEQDKTKDIDTPKAVEAKMINGILTPVSITTPPTSGNSGTCASTGNVSLLHAKRDNNIIITNSLLKMAGKKIQPRILVLNNGSLEPKQLSQQQQQSSSSSSPSEERPRASVTEPVSIRIKTESHVSPQMYTPATQKKQSRAKKSFPNKAPRLPQLLPKLPKPPASSLDAMVYIPAQRGENGLDYQLPPPEAGPVSAQLHRGANELVKRMAQLMEEAIKEAADSGNNDTTNTTVDSHQATIHSLRLQIERMRWQHQQQLAELKHNTDRTLREMRASLEAERLRAIEEVRKEAEEDKARCIEATKSKQWCSQCGREALFYCCWNTAYCDHLCQQAHWQTHQRKCAQKPTGVTSSPGDTGNKQQQKGNTSDKGSTGVGTLDVSVTRSGFRSPNVITKNLKIP